MRALRSAMCLAAFALTVSSARAADAASPAGRWQGAITLPGGELAISVALTPAADGGWTGTIDIPAQGLRELALSEIAVEGRRVHFQMPGVPGQPTFDGVLATDGEAIAGTFRQSGQSLPFALRRTTAAAASAPAPSPPAQPVPGEGAVGEWLGALDVGSLKLRLALHVEPAGTGGLAAILDSIDQGAKIPIDEVTFAERKLRLAIASINASFEGTMTADGSAVEGTWSQGGRQFPVKFQRLAQAFALERPQEPRPPFPYETRDVTFESAAGDARLAGTLVLPHGEGPFPAVALVSGSGLQDRDESIMGHKPFLVLADALARRGIASLRWDDRGAGASTGDHMGSTMEAFAADARAGVAFLRTASGVDRGAVGIVGHSEGGLVAPMAAAADPAVAFLVMLAAPGEPMASLLQRQSRALFALRGVDAGLVERALANQAAELALVADPALSTDALRSALRARAAKDLEQLSAEERARLGIDDAAVERSIELSATPWFRSLMRQDPAVYLRQVKVPVLALFGERDVQVDAQVNAAAVRTALAATGSDHEVRVLPGLNHLFQHAATGSPDEYGTIEETFAPEALESIGDWILGRFGPGRRGSSAAADAAH